MIPKDSKIEEKTFLTKIVCKVITHSAIFSSLPLIKNNDKQNAVQT